MHQKGERGCGRLGGGRCKGAWKSMKYNGAAIGLAMAMVSYSKAPIVYMNIVDIVLPICVPSQQSALVRAALYSEPCRTPPHVNQIIDTYHASVSVDL